MEFLIVLLVVVLVAAIGVWLYIAKQGDANFKFLVDQRTDFTLTAITKESASFSATVPFVNNGTQDGTLMDVFPRHFLPYEQFDAVDTDSRLAFNKANRSDGYWEAYIVPVSDGGSIILTVKFTAKSGDIKAALKEMVDMPIDIIYQVVARGLWYLAKERLIMTADEIHKALATGEKAVARSEEQI